MLENSEISSLAPFLGYGGSGEGYGSLPMGFWGLLQVKRGEEHVTELGEKGKEDGSVLHMGDESTKPILGRGNVVIEFSSGKTITLFNVVYVLGLRNNLMSGPVLNKCGSKQVYESDKYILSRHGVFIGFGYYNNGMFMLNLNKVPSIVNSIYMAYSLVVDSKLWHARLGHVHYQCLNDMSKDSLIPSFDKYMEKCNACMLTKITREPFKDIKRNSVLLELIHSDLCDFYATSSIGNKKYVVTYIDDASRFCYVYLLHAKDEALDKFKIYKTEVELQQNSLIKTLCTDRDGEYCDPSYFQSVGIIHQTMAPYTSQQNSVTERKNRALKEMVNFMLSYSGLSEGFWGEAMLTTCYLLNRVPNKKQDWGCRAVVRLLEPKASLLDMLSIPKHIGSIMENNTWVLSDLPPGCKPLGCKWIFKKKIKVRGTIDKFKAQLVIQGFRQTEGIDYFDTYAPVARISTIRLLIALVATHNLVIYQMDVKTTFLNSYLEEEIYMKKPEEFVMRVKEHKVYKCVYYKFDESGKGVIICLYVDDMLIFGTDQNQVDKTKEFLSSNFSMKYIGEADVILGIRIKRENKGLTITQSHYIEKILKKFNCKGCGPVSTPMEAGIKSMPYMGKPVNQLEYLHAIGCLMYAMTSTRPDIAYAIKKLSRFTSNPSNHHWEAIIRVFRYLKKTMNYGLSYVGFLSVIEGYSDASWITNSEDHTSTTGWVFLLGGGAISWGSRKKTCITDSTMESEFCDSATTLAKAYSQLYNGKSRHLGVRHVMVRELITNGVISVDFVRSQQNMENHLTKGLAKDLVHKSAIRMGLHLKISSNGEDKWVWNGNASGNFKVKTLSKSVQSSLLKNDVIGRIEKCGYSTRLNKILQGVFYFSVWAIWKWRNKNVNVMPEEIARIKDGDIFPSIQSFFIIAVQTPGSGISFLLAVGTPSTGSGNLYCQWELSPGSGNALCILFPTVIKIATSSLHD
uniref:Zinc finger, CCHC-type n=1 Tax=Tanacetum cinerariifolium TaxID=118510 RepID=A0A6L2N851_TANCI|nr:zinc finger, CCHC-type [Tanacetum cinerariifolium]